MGTAHWPVYSTTQRLHDSHSPALCVCLLPSRPGECDLVLVHTDSFAQAGKTLDIHARTKIRYDYSYIERYDGN